MAGRFFNRIFATLSYLFFEEISPKFQADALKNLMDYIYILFEKSFHHFDYFVQLYFMMYDDLIENEIQLANITKEQNVLVIGCGSLPATSILLVQKTGAKIKGIDKDKRAVLQAKKFIESYQLDDRLQFEYTEDLSVDISSVDVIFIAYGIKQESFVFDKLDKIIRNDTQIIYRIPFNIDEHKVLDSINKTSDFTIEKKVITPSMGSTISLLLKKNS
jgi:precorrin-6B methylase 2